MVRQSFGKWLFKNGKWREHLVYNGKGGFDASTMKKYKASRLPSESNSGCKDRHTIHDFAMLCYAFLGYTGVFRYRADVAS